MGRDIDCLLIHAPKQNCYYKPINEHMSVMSIAMGLFAIANLVHQKGYKTQILHLGIEKILNPNFSIKKYIQHSKPKIVGLSLHWHLQSYDVIEIIRQIKLANPGIFNVIGGYTASYFHEEIVKEFSDIDGVIRGDGEIPFLALVEEVFKSNTNLSRIPNLTWRNGNRVIKNEISYVAKTQDLDKLNFANLELLKNHQFYAKFVNQQGIWLKGFGSKINGILIGTKQRVFPLSTSRGCILDCDFCPGSKFSQARICSRTEIAIRSISKVIETIKEAVKYNYNTVFFEYLPLPYFEELFEAIKAQKTEIGAIMDCNVLPTKEILRKFKETFSDKLDSRIVLNVCTITEKTRKSLLNDSYFSDIELMEIISYLNELKVPTRIFCCVDTTSRNNDMEIAKRFQEKLQTKYISIIPVSGDIAPGSRLYEDSESYGIAQKKYSFTDFYKSHRYTKNSFFISSIHPYSQNIPTEVEELQKLICKDFCRLGTVFSILFSFPLFQGLFSQKIINRCGRALCRISAFYWRIKKIFRR